MPPLHPAWRIIGLLLAVGFFGLAAGGIVRGRFDNPETGLLERARNPVAFWLSAIGPVLFGWYLLAVVLGRTLPWLARPERWGLIGLYARRRSDNG